MKNKLLILTKMQSNAKIVIKNLNQMKFKNSAVFNAKRIMSVLILLNVKTSFVKNLFRKMIPYA